MSDRSVIKQPWMTTGLLNSAKTKDRLFRRQLGKGETDKTRVKFTKYRNMFNKLKREAKNSHYKAKLDQYKFDIRKTWSVMNSIIGRNTNRQKISEAFFLNGKMVTNPNIITNAFCDYFTNIGPNCAKRIGQPDKPFDLSLIHI